MNLRAWIPTYLSNYKEGTMKGTSYHQLELLVRLIPGSLLDLPMSEIKPMDLQAFFNSFAAKYSKSYVDKMRVMVKGLFRAACENEIIKKRSYGPRSHFSFIPRQMICASSCLTALIMTIQAYFSASIICRSQCETAIWYT